ncbi:MAG: peroxiredoxin [Patescibacteria group bacterium]
MLKIGDRTPDWEAKDQNGDIHRSADYLGHWVVLYFYPKDNTPGCTQEACAFRDAYPEFKKDKVAVLGVSKDSIESHEKFANEFRLPFTLLADVDHRLVKDFGADGLSGRISYLIDPSGRIAKAYSRVNPAEHAQEVLRDLAALEK